MDSEAEIEQRNVQRYLATQPHISPGDLSCLPDHCGQSHPPSAGQTLRAVTGLGLKPKVSQERWYLGLYGCKRPQCMSVL